MCPFALKTHQQKGASAPEVLQFVDVFCSKCFVSLSEGFTMHKVCRFLQPWFRFFSVLAHPNTGPTRRAGFVGVPKRLGSGRSFSPFVLFIRPARRGFGTPTVASRWEHLIRHVRTSSFTLLWKTICLLAPSGPGVSTCSFTFQVQYFNCQVTSNGMVAINLTLEDSNQWHFL